MSRWWAESAYEPIEENPMLGFRGASRYYNQRYCAGFALECRAMKKCATKWA
jgi:pyruvate,water dikinase